MTTKREEKEIIRLIRLDLLGLLSQQEKNKLQKWQEQSATNEKLLRKIRKEQQLLCEMPRFLRKNSEEAWEKFRKQIVIVPKQQQRHKKFRQWLKYAAVVFPLFLCFTVWMITKQNTILPKQNKLPATPMLMLQNGQKFDLRKTAHSVIQPESHLEILNTDGQLIYDTTGSHDTTTENAIHIPRGCEYRLLLSDGSSIWLNADSYLKYPVVFNGNERRVYLNGEACFQIKADSTRPFYVETQDLTVKVYGTVFNLNTHYLQGTRTVLAEGSIAILREKGETLYMQPGERADFYRETNSFKIEKVNALSYIAWRDGFFIFDDESLEEILHTLALWYDKEVFYLNDKRRQLHFTCHLKRYERIETILSAISEVTGVIFKCNEKTILIQ